MKNILITGVGGLIGSEAARFFSNLGWRIIGIDNNYRGNFFGKEGSVEGQIKSLVTDTDNFIYYNIDIRDREGLKKVFTSWDIHAIIHAAAQPSHDLAARIPLEDFEVNALATVLILENARNYCKAAPFIHFSTNKVFGDNPNKIKLVELETRFDFDDPLYKNGITEFFYIDNCLHSLYGAGKVAADIYVQEYGKYYGMKTCCLRAGCLTGPNHAGTELHGFLDYLIKCNVEERIYNIFGYKGKQVRSNIHSLDVSRFMLEFINCPGKGEVYNLGGGKANSISIIEGIDKIEKISGIKMKTNYIETARKGDHLCWYESDAKIKKDYPNYKLTKNLDDIFNEIYEKYKKK